MSAIKSNLPALIVVLPLLAGVLVSLLGRKGRAWWLTSLTTLLTFGLAIWLTGLVLVAQDQVISYTFGPWQPVAMQGSSTLVPIGIEYRVDLINALVLLIVSGSAAVVTLTARLTVAREIESDRLHFFYAVYLLCITGLLGITITGDAFNLYVLLEISSLTAYALVAMGKGSDRRALTASFHYLLMGTVGASFILLGVGYLFMVTGTLNMADMAVQLSEQGANRTTATACALIAAGSALKMGLFPMHQWLPNAYTYAPSAISALLASTATKVAVYVGLRFFFTIFQPAGFENTASGTLLFCGSLAILFGSIRAIQQTNIKRLLGYSSVAQIGYMVIGLALACGAPTAPAAELGLRGTLLHMLNHAMVKGALFIAAGAVFYRTGSTDLKSLKGLFRKMPITASTIAIAGLGLIGLPLTGGFISKWFLVSSAVSSGYWMVAATILVGSVLAIIYMLRMVEPMVFARPDEGPTVSEAPISIILPAWILIAGSFYCGINGEWVRDVIDGAVRMLVPA